jgi:type II secretory pathway pseudopilin PulG
MSHTRNSESGFTLAGLIVMMTVIAVTIAYTVPKQWSLAVGRDRDQQTLFAMKQYARAIQAFQEKNHTAPVSLDQLAKARSPRFLRGNGELLDPLTGKFDWIVIPQSAAQQPGQQNNPAMPLPDRPRTPLPPTSVPVSPTQPGQAGGFVGPIIGVRPNKTGTSYIFVNGSDSYEQWSYTTEDLKQEIAQHQNAALMK